MIKVLLVCQGNICRSPMAEGVLQDMVNKAGLSDQIWVDSAGTIGYHVGERAHSGTRAILAHHNIAYDGRSRQLAKVDYDAYDYILAMDRSNLSAINSRQPSGTNPVIRLFLEYADNPRTMEVPDPYYSGDFESVYQLVEAGARGLLQAIREEHNL